MATKTGRLEIRAESQFLDLLDDLAKASGTSKTKVIDRAVGLYARALKEAEEGKVIRFLSAEEDAALISHATTSHIGNLLRPRYTTSVHDVNNSLFELSDAAKKVFIGNIIAANYDVRNVINASEDSPNNL
jgi:hypothetical protein